MQMGEMRNSLWEHILARTCQWPRESVLLLGSLGSCSISGENMFPRRPEHSWGPQRLDPYVNTTFLLLISYSKPDLTQNTREPRNLPCGFKQCATKTDTAYFTTSDLLNHIKSNHLEGIKWDCYSTFCQRGRRPPILISIYQYATSTHQMQ